MSIARYLCRERRHLLRFSVMEYASLLQHISITHSNLPLLEILTWMNAIARMTRIITSLTSIPHDNALLMALVWLPRKALINITKGRTIDKSLLSLIRCENQEISLYKIQSYIVIVAVSRIILEQFTKSILYDPIPLLCKIEPKEYMQINNPIVSLMQIFRNIHAKFPFLLQSPTEYFTYALHHSSLKNDSENLITELQEVNVILYAVRRIEQVHKKVMSKEEIFGIIDKLSEFTVEIIRFYGINPREFFTEGGGFYFSLVQLLAYMQYNKINQVTPQTAVIMKFIPLQFYKDSEKPYEELQKECNRIITHCPHIIDVDETALENIFFEKLLLSVDTERPLSFFEDIGQIVIALAKIHSMQSKKGTHIQELLFTLCGLSKSTLVFITHFPEIFFSDLVYNFPSAFFDSIYSNLQEYCNNKEFQYKVLACFISPLSIVESSSITNIDVNTVSLYTEKAMTLLTSMYGLLTCKEGYTNDTLFNALLYLMPLYYTYPSHQDEVDTIYSEAPLQLVSHVNEVLEVITTGSSIPLQELCSKPKNLLPKYRKDQQEDNNDRL